MAFVQEEMEKAKGKKVGEQDKESAFNVRSLLGEKKTDPNEELNKKLLKAARDGGPVSLQCVFVSNWEILSGPSRTYTLFKAFIT